MKKVSRFIVILLAIGGFFSLGFADPASDITGPIGITSRP